jgi:hypothetical protein
LNKKKIYVNLILLLLSLGIGLGICELAVRWLRPQVTYYDAVKYSMCFFRRSPLLPYELKPNISIKQYTTEREKGDEEYVVSINSLGFRDTEFTVDKPDNTYRIMCVGDSMVFGLAVNNGKTFPDYLERISNRKKIPAASGKRVEVINAGYASGFSPDSFYLFLRKIGLAYKPDMVILGYFVKNDFADLFETEWVEEKNGLPLKIDSTSRMVDDKGFFRMKCDLAKYDIPLLRDSHLYLLLCNEFSLDFYYFKIKQKIFGLLGKKITLYCNALPGPYNDLYRFSYSAEIEEKFSLSMRLLKNTHELCQDNGVKFAVVIIPSGAQIKKRIWDKKVEDLPFPTRPADIYPQTRITKYLEREGIAYLNPLPDLRKVKGRMNLNGDEDGHFSPLGNKALAESVSGYLRKQTDLTPMLGAGT